MTQGSSATKAVAPTPTITMSEPRSLGALWCTIPDELKLQVMEDVMPKGEIISASSYDRLLYPLLTSSTTYDIAKEVISKRVCANNVFNVVLDPWESIDRVLYPAAAMRPLIQNLRVEIPFIKARTIPFLEKIAQI